MNLNNWVLVKSDTPEGLIIKLNELNVKPDHIIRIGKHYDGTFGKFGSYVYAFRVYTDTEPERKPKRGRKKAIKDV